METTDNERARLRKTQRRQPGGWAGHGEAAKLEAYLSINEIADMLSIHRGTVYRRVLPWIKANCKRPFCRIGNRPRFRKGAVEAYIEHHSPKDF
ncbi:MAG: helix-turn-helix domain-containing protein [Anaerohalosphaeraceae bacterium]|jgi:excisionase family DNA binding protein